LRFFHDQLRSFGTLDEPFAYAAFLLLGLTGLVVWFRPGLVTFAAGAIIVTGLALSFVRTAALVLLAVAGLWLARRNYTASSVFLMSVAVVLAVAVVAVSSSATESRTVRTGTSTFLTVNGRTEGWKLFLGDPEVWVVGHGVGEVGTAAERATYRISQDPNEAGKRWAVDSGYFAVIADVGLLGLMALLAIFVRLIGRTLPLARQGSAPAWLALGLVSVLMIDAVTRASFTGFPTAFLALLLTGIAVGAALDGPQTREDRRTRRPWR
jgi:O-antigen ligase